MDFGLQGKVAVITGAGGVICGVMAKEMARQGMKVALLDIMEEQAEKVAGEIREEGGDALAVQANVLDKASLEQARDQAGQEAEQISREAPELRGKYFAWFTISNVAMLVLLLALGAVL